MVGKLGVLGTLGGGGGAPPRGAFTMERTAFTMKRTGTGGERASVLFMVNESQ